MTDSTHSTLGHPKHLEMLSDNFMKQVTLLRDIPLLKLPDRLKKSFVLIEAIISGALAVHLLARQGFTSDVYVVLRALIERVVTMFYLQAASEEEFESYMQYSMQKTYRKMEQTLSAGDKKLTIKMTDQFDLSSAPGLKAAVDKFTGTKGHPKTRWSPTSIENKLAIIERANITKTEALMFNILAFYDDCSEASHATLYGCTFHRGIFQPGKRPTTKQEMDQSHMDNLTLIFMLGAVMLSEVNKYLFTICEATELAEKAAQVDKELRELMRSVLKDLKQPRNINVSLEL